MNNYIVTESSKNIRLLARQNMAGLWKSAILAMAIYTICTSLPVVLLDQFFGVPYEELLGLEMYTSDMSGDKISAVSGIYTILVTGAFTLGITIFFIELIRNKKADLGHTFAGFEHFFKTLGLMVVIGIFTALWSLLFIVPGIIAALRYSQAFYILADDPNKGIMECINESKQMMKGNKSKYFCLGLSFIGWILLAGCFEGACETIFDTMLGSGFAYSILSFVTTAIATCGVTAYISGAQTIFYEMLNGNLRPASEYIPPLSFDNDNQEDL